MNVLVIVAASAALAAMRCLGGAADVDDKLGNVEGPVLCGYFCVGLDAIFGFVDRICVIFAGLDRLGR